MRSKTCLVVAAFLCVSGVELARGSIMFRTVALSGQAVPGGSFAGETFASFGVPTINQSGLTAFDASATFTGAISSGTNANTGLVMSEGSGVLTLESQLGTLAPSAAGTGTSTSWSGTWNVNSNTPFLDGLGHLTLQGGLRFGSNGGSNGSDGTVVTSANSSGIWSESPGSLSLVARQGFSPVGSATLTTLTTLGAVNPSGAFVFTGATSDGLNGILSNRTGALAYVVNGAAVAPGASGATFLSNGFSGPVINASGQVAFKATLTTGSGSPAVTSTTNQGIWSEGSGSLQLVARAGSQAPGTANGDLFGTSFTSPDFNNLGETAFSNTLVTNTGSGDVTSTNNGGVWSEGGGSLHLVVRKGAAAPGASSGSIVPVFNTFSTVVINHSGLTAFIGTLQTGSGSAYTGGIWSEAPGGMGTLTAIALDGGQAPGTAIGDHFSSIGNLMMNALGEVAFSGFLATGTGDVTSSNNSGVWAQDASGALQLVIRTGESFQVAPGDVRTISGYSFGSSSGGEEGRQMTWNDSEQLAVYLTFTNGTSGVFTATVPEPGTAGVAMVPMAGLLMRRRRRVSVTA
jgi:hypothetical protein